MSTDTSGGAARADRSAELADIVRELQASADQEGWGAAVPSIVAGLLASMPDAFGDHEGPRRSTLIPWTVQRSGGA